jgi:hypothetical protein
MTTKKRLLIIRASKDICGNELGLMSHQAEILGMDVVSKNLSYGGQLDEVLNTETPYDYIYLCSHGCREGFEIHLENTSEQEIMTWGNFAGVICENHAVASNGILLLACCRGGMNAVATEMFICCPEIDYVCGPYSNVLPCDITTGFIVFLHSMETKRSEPAYAAIKASAATDFTFKCFDRVEVETQVNYHIRKKEIEEDFSKEFEAINYLPNELKK